MGEDAARAAQDYALFIAKQDWAEVTVALVAFLKRRGVAEHLRDNLVGEAVLRVFEWDRSPWDPLKNPSLVAHALSVCSSIVSHMFRDDKSRKTTPLGDDLPDVAPDSARDVETLLLKEERAARARAAVVKKLAGKDLALAVFDLEERCVTEPNEQAKELNVSVVQVYRARKLLWEVVRDLGRDSSDSDIRAVLGGAAAEEMA
jgi:hypothetical protein